MQLSIREVLQLAERCFAAADVSQGPARSCAESIWWTELYREAGFGTLHSLLDELQSVDRAALTLREHGEAVSVIEGESQPSIVASDPLLDLASARANQQGLGLAYATTEADDTSLPTIGHVAYKAAKRGLVGVLTYTDGTESGSVVGVPTDGHPLVAETTLPAPSTALQDVHRLVRSEDHHQGNVLLTKTFFDATATGSAETADERFVEQVLQRATEAASGHDTGAESGVGLLCIDPRHPRRTERVQRLVSEYVDDEVDRFTTVFRPERIEERVETLLHEGVEVERSRWEDVFEYNTGVLTPPFEGSEQGAGFGLSD